MDRRKAIRNTGLLIGGAVATPSLIVLLNACKSESRLNWAPQFFTEEEANCISTLVDTILPRTETPGALDVNVDVFLDRIFAQTYDEKGQQKVRTDIAAFNSDCKKSHGAVFAKLSDEDRVSVLQAAERNSGKFNPGVWGKTIGTQEPIGFYRSIKSMAIWAYFTSEKIGKEVLSYDPIPGAYLGCIPLSDVGNSWSL
jgi:hypothetical protein